MTAVLIIAAITGAFWLGYFVGRRIGYRKGKEDGLFTGITETVKAAYELANVEFVKEVKP